MEQGYASALAADACGHASPQHSTAFALGLTHPWALEQLRKFGNKRCILVDGTHGAAVLFSSAVAGYVLIRHLQQLTDGNTSLPR